MLQAQNSHPLSVVVTMDVEEEGLFSGRYRRRGTTVRNVAALRRLAPLSRELGFPLTLLCAHPVFTDPEACRTLEYMRDHCGAEIGAHLHHWSTPPYESDEIFCPGTPVRTHLLGRDLLESRLDSLLAAGRAFQGAGLTSFRMGRWDLKKELFPLLAERGILADSSVCPLRAFAGGADHFLAPAQPWRPLGRHSGLLEVPLTQICPLPGLPGLWQALFRRCPKKDSFHFLAAVSANPFWHTDAVMRLCARLIVRRKSPVLCLFWHSSELMPGGSPQVPDAASADRVFSRIFSFFRWLRENFEVRGRTLSGLSRDPADWPGRDDLSPVRGTAAGDW